MDTVRESLVAAVLADSSSVVVTPWSPPMSVGAISRSWIGLKLL
jgi:hypothetical protein